ncbi:MAG: leucine-rich repeat protein [Treponema sp.]|jgi:hypothetical protein|nr:leucine-rich repeat protein [Treponema sp.]
MIEFFTFISKQKIGNIILVCIFIIPYIFWIIWVIDKNILKLISWIISKASQNRREIKIIAGKTKHYIWIVYKNIYLALLIPFVVFCIKWDNFNKYISEIITVVGLISIPYIIYIFSILRIVFSNIIEWGIRLMNIFADIMKRSTRKILAYGITLFIMPVLGFGSIFVIILFPLIVAWIYVEWVQWLVRMIKKRGIVKQKKMLILYKYRDLSNWKTYREDYLEGKLFFSDRRQLNDPAECISLLNRTSSRVNEERSASKREDGDYDPLEKYRICSMTGDPGNFVMWANYSSGNTGVCIEFLIDPELLKKEDIKCEKVFYTKFLPTVEDFVYPYDSMKKKLPWKDIRKFIFHKLNDWKYEDEWRLVKEFDKTDEPNNKLYSLKIGTAVRIICGYKCTPDFVEQLKEEVQIPVDQVTYEQSDKQGVYLCVPGDSDKVYGEFANDEWKYHIEDGNVKITAYIGKSQEMNIPAFIGGKPVTTIGEKAFQDRKDITSVTIPSGVSKIEPLAFSRCSGLITASLGKDLKIIGKNAFAFCSDLTSVNFIGVSVIEKDAFRDCSALTSVNLPDGVSAIGKGAFRNCSSLTSINIPDSVSNIGDEAFRKCYKINSVTISESAKQRIKAYVFEDSSVNW